MDDLTARYEAWREERVALHDRENDGGFVGATDWGDSDDEAVRLLHDFADAWAERNKTPKIYRLTGKPLSNVLGELAGELGGELAVEIDDEGCHVRARISRWAAWRAPEQMEPVT